MNASQEDIVADLKALTPALQKLGEAGSDLPKSLQLLLTIPFTDEAVNGVKGDYFNLYAKIDLNLQDDHRQPVPQQAQPAAGRPDRRRPDRRPGRRGRTARCCRSRSSAAARPGSRTPSGGSGLGGLLGGLLGGGS